MTFLPTERTDYCELTLDVDGDPFPVCARGQAASTLGDVQKGQRVEVTGRLILIRWRTAQGPRDRAAVEALEIARHAGAG